MTKELVVLNKLGVHARPAALFVKTANRFACDIFVEKDGEKVNGKSIMGLMMLAAGPGSKLLIHAEGPDAAKAIAEIESLLKRKFDEECDTPPITDPAGGALEFVTCNLQPATGNL